MGELFRLSRISAGFIAILVGYTSSAVIVFQAAVSAGATEAEVISWLFALGIGLGSTSIGLSLFYRIPVLTAWSTPGAALLVTGLSGVSMEEAVGAFLFCSLLITLCGISGWFEKIMQYVPRSLSSALLAGVLVRFGLDLFVVLESQTILVTAMLGTYLLARNRFPRYVTPLALLAGLIVTASMGLLNMDALSWEPVTPVFISPIFTMSAIISVGIPLFIVTMTSQNVPGVAVLRAHGYQASASPLISWTGVTGLMLAPFGGFTFNLAAITAAICMGKDADPDPAKRYLAAVWGGIFYLVAGVSAGTVVGFFNAFPSELVMGIAGLALLGTIGSSLSTSLAEEDSREGALLTFLATASGISVMGVGSAFWGLVIGLLAYSLKHTPLLTCSENSQK